MGAHGVALNAEPAGTFAISLREGSDMDGLCGRTMIAYPNLVARTLCPRSRGETAKVRGALADRLRDSNVACVVQRVSTRAVQSLR